MSSRRKSRPPSKKATDLPVGTEITTKDGQLWMVTQNTRVLSDGTKKSRKSWMKLNKRWSKNFKPSQDKKQEYPKGKSYLIHDNGGRPFKVVIGTKDAWIYKCPESNEKLIKQYKFKKVFIGKSTGKPRMADHEPNESKQFIGNSILLQLSGNKYVYIGDYIYEFSPEDEIVKYFSLVGHSDVPYPVAVGTENVYFMLDKKYVPRDEFPDKMTNEDWEGAYELFYGKSKQVKKGSRWVIEYTEEPLKEYAKRMKSIKQVQKRIFC